MSKANNLKSQIWELAKEFKMLEANYLRPQNMCSIKLQQSLNGLKQSRRMWHNHFIKYLLEEGYMNNLICPCVFIKGSKTILQL